MPWPYYAWKKSTQYPLTRRLAESQRRSRHFGEEKNIFPMPGSETVIIQPVA
jgi:hypothetical protein